MTGGGGAGHSAAGHAKKKRGGRKVEGAKSNFLLPFSFISVPTPQPVLGGGGGGGGFGGFGFAQKKREENLCKAKGEMEAKVIPFFSNARIAKDFPFSFSPSVLANSARGGKRGRGGKKILGLRQTETAEEKEKGGKGEKIGRFCNFSKKNGSRGKKRRKEEKMGEEEKFLISAPLGKKRGALFLCRSSWRGFFAQFSPPFYLQCTVGPNPNQPRKATV